MPGFLTQTVGTPTKPGKPRRYETETQTRLASSRLGGDFCFLDLGEEDVADVVPVGDEGEGRVGVLVGGGEVGLGAIEVGPGEIHEEFGLAPRGFEGIGDGAFEFAGGFETF